MNSLQVSFQLLTPTFLSGAEQQKSELRVPSIKGCLRYWLRAIHPNYQEREELLFGSADTGQSRVLLRLDTSGLKSETDRRLFSSLGYFGFSLKGNNKQPARACLLPNQTFNLLCLMRPGEEELSKELLASLWLLGHVGSLGSRARRGFGSLSLQEWNWEDEMDKQLPLLTHAQTIDDAIQLFRKGLHTLYSWFPGKYSDQHTTLPPSSSFFVQKTGSTNWLAVMRQVQDEVKEYRKRNKVYRIMLGLPLTMGRDKVDAREAPERVASPVYLRIWKINKQYYPVYFFLQAPFPSILPNKSSRIPIHTFDYEKARDHFSDYLVDKGFRQEGCR